MRIRSLFAVLQRLFRILRTPGYQRISKVSKKGMGSSTIKRKSVLSTRGKYLQLLPTRTWPQFDSREFLRGKSKFQGKLWLRLFPILNYSINLWCTNSKFSYQNDLLSFIWNAIILAPLITYVSQRFQPSGFRLFFDYVVSDNGRKGVLEIPKFFIDSSVHYWNLWSFFAIQKLLKNVVITY